MSNKTVLITKEKRVNLLQNLLIEYRENLSKLKDL